MMPAALFSPEALQRITNETLKTANIPAGHTNAIIWDADTHGASVVAHFTLGQTPGITAQHDWTLDAAYEHVWTGDNRAGVQLVDSW